MREKLTKMDSVEARNYLHKLHYQDLISVDEAINAFQISLAFCNHEKAIYYKEVCYDLVYEMFVEIILNIEQREYFDKFKKYYELWFNVVHYETKYIFIAILLSKQKFITYWNELVDIINRHGNFLKHTQVHGLTEKSLLELIGLLTASIHDTKSNYRSVEASYVGSYTINIEIAKKALKLIRDDRKDLQELVTARVSYINKLNNLNDSSEFLSNIGEFTSNMEKFMIAKRVTTK